MFGRNWLAFTTAAYKGIGIPLGSCNIGHATSVSVNHLAALSAGKYDRSQYSTMRQQDQGNSSTRVAVLYQALDPPVIGGVRKPKKPGGMYAPI